MLDRLETHYAALPPLRRLLLLWTVSGATIHAAIPALHSAITPAGPAALWLWLLPLAGLALELMAAPRVQQANSVATTSAVLIARRRRVAMVPPRGAVSRRDRPRSPKPAPAAQPVRRAG